MIKIFTKIRRKLIAENNLSQYLVYAIGEIILVVIGILIALSINGWNNNRISRDRSNDFNQRLLAEVNENLELADNKIKIINSMISSSKGILGLFNEPINKESSKTLDSLIYIAISAGRISFRTGTLSEGLNTGQVALIESVVLKSKLYGLPSNIEYVGDYDKTHSAFNAEVLQSFLYKNFNFRSMDHIYSGFDIGASKFDYQHHRSLLQNEEFENLIDNHFYQAKLKLQFHSDLANEYVEIKKLIEAELAAHL